MKARKYTVLIVDDDEDERFLLKMTFETLAITYKVQFAASGEEAIRYFKGEGAFADRSKFEFPSYVLTDLKMPSGDGFHVLEFLKNNPALSVIPVVMFSSSEDEDDIRQAYLLGASSFFVKPPQLSDLQALLKKIHDYWTDCEVPQVDAAGYAIPTTSSGRLGDRYAKPQR